MDITQNQARGLIVGGFLVAGTLLMAPAVLSSCSHGQHRAERLPAVAPADSETIAPGTTIICDDHVFSVCRTYPPGVPVPEPSRPIPFRPLPTVHGAITLDGTR